METKKRDVELTVDIVVVVDFTNVLMIKRAKPPFEDKFVLPGGHVESSDMSLAQAAARELWEETGLMVSPSNMSYLMHLDQLGRDPRGHKVSAVFMTKVTQDEYRLARAGSDAASIELVSLNQAKGEVVGFDHFQAIVRARSIISSFLSSD